MDTGIYTDYCSVFNLDSSETVAYNNPLFPAYVRYGILSNYPDYSAISHWHGDLEFISIKKGSMTYNVNGELITLSENDGIMINSRQLHYGFSAEHQECEFICIVLSTELLRGNEWFYRNYIETITENSSCPYLYLDHNGWQAAILAKIEEIYSSFQAVPQHEPSDVQPYFDLIRCFYAIIEILHKHLPAAPKAVGKESFELSSLKSMITYVEEHLTEHILLEDLCSAGACCKSRCSLLFKKYLRDTPISYITKLRLRKSLASLLEPDSSITDIAYEYGFSGASYYCETFRKYYGTSPLKYKKERLNA